MSSSFVEFPKIPRLTRECIITEKIDGTNALVHIIDPNAEPTPLSSDLTIALQASGLVMLAGSRTRYITPQSDNFGFARWVQAHAEELWTLGPGRHYGEWWGFGIQRGYGLPKGEKRFSLFNVSRWAPYWTETEQIAAGQYLLPPCVGVVPVLWTGLFDTNAVTEQVERLRRTGSAVMPGFMNPEGVVVFHVAGRTLFKKTIEGDESHKG